MTTSHEPTSPRYPARMTEADWRIERREDGFWLCHRRENDTWEDYAGPHKRRTDARDKLARLRMRYLSDQRKLGSAHEHEWVMRFGERFCAVCGEGRIPG